MWLCGAVFVVYSHQRWLVCRHLASLILSPLSLLSHVKVEKRDEDSSRMQLKEEVSGENKMEGLIRRSVLGQLSFMS